MKRARADTDQNVGSNDYDDEDLFGPMSDDEWDKLEKQLKTTVTVIVACHTNDLHFEGETLSVITGTRKSGESSKKTTTYLSGQPTQFDSALWCLLNPGYMDIEGVRVWNQPMFTGRRTTNLSLNELEYVNSNRVFLLYYANESNIGEQQIV
ncbi:hypothetical protein PHMEG_0005042 [Phytophthora megakarya]|uniref:Uncharacterized protein n=1 Tax=Phytophthora megakarya TaxID=4795 RepID=A0A225WTW9_9STRA|nr:hypothetical protein PHMEG_0005042 [Phytophthora megakarya]